MVGVVVFTHGSREAAVKQIIDNICAKLQKLLGSMYLVTFAALQFDDATLQKAVESFVQMGIVKIVIQPYFLFEGVHIKKDLIGQAEAIRQKYPQLEIILGRSFGDDERIAEILADRVLES